MAQIRLLWEGANLGANQQDNRKNKFGGDRGKAAGCGRDIVFIHVGWFRFEELGSERSELGLLFPDNKKRIEKRLLLSVGKGGRKQNQIFLDLCLF